MQISVSSENGKVPLAPKGAMPPALFFLMCGFFEKVAHDPEHRGTQMFD